MGRLNKLPLISVSVSNDPYRNKYGMTCFSDDKLSKSVSISSASLMAFCRYARFFLNSNLLIVTWKELIPRLKLYLVFRYAWYLFLGYTCRYQVLSGFNINCSLTSRRIWHMIGKMLLKQWDMSFIKKCRLEVTWYQLISFYKLLKQNDNKHD